VFVHTPGAAPHFVSDEGHPHVPLQVPPLAHTSPALPPATPQPGVAPQCCVLLLGSTHVPPQFTSKPGQVTRQVEELQTSPEVRQFVPALPASPVPQPAVAPQC
jgi:hypothetical protein